MVQGWDFPRHLLQSHGYEWIEAFYILPDHYKRYKLGQLPEPPTPILLSGHVVYQPAHLASLDHMPCPRLLSGCGVRPCFDSELGWDMSSRARGFSQLFCLSLWRMIPVR